MIRQCIKDDHHLLYNIIRSYVLRMRLADSKQANEVAEEILSQTTIAALRSADRFDLERNVRSWLLGIAANLIRNKIRSNGLRNQREIQIHDLYQTHTDLSEAELFDYVDKHTTHTLAELADHRMLLESALKKLHPEEVKLLQLAILQEINRDTIAAHLGIQPGAARTRLYRVLKKLRHVLSEE